MKPKIIKGEQTENLRQNIVELMAETTFYNDDIDIIRKHIVTLKVLFDAIDSFSD